MTNSEEETINLWKHLSDKKNWRIVQLPNGYYQTEYRDIENKETWYDVTRRETLESAEAAIDGSVEHYGKKLEFVKGPKVVKTFK
jgi:predicted NUDIX family NTP pyrophosphohydrolase